MRKRKRQRVDRQEAGETGWRLLPMVSVVSLGAEIRLSLPSFAHGFGATAEEQFVFDNVDDFQILAGRIVVLLCL